MDSVILIDGEQSSEVSALDRGLLYGQGLFETIRVVGGKLPLLDLHLQRLLGDCEKVCISAPAASQLHGYIKQVLSVAGEALPTLSGRLKILVTGGNAGAGYAAEDSAKARVILQFFPVPPYVVDTVSACICNTALADSLLAGVKHCNRLEQVLAANEIRAKQCQEGIVLDQRGNIVEGVASNLVFQVGGELLTPQLKSAGVAGVMRQYLLQRKRIKEAEGPIPLNILAHAEQVYFINSFRGAWALDRLVIGESAHDDRAILSLKNTAKGASLREGGRIVLTYNKSAQRQQFVDDVNAVFAQS
ncbi:aminodeoxychorismate lyase [Simiduia aestuariiviva]|uniref:Aminodeoxychorismate lyase n=1 Tax=Simiduia aestuariiviva TaxID=1510459 RepID=A0A839US36_9GAMM|nr:4-amino-4-deoxychorismate lyase [Simiduia aestuariiviva]